MSQPIWWNYLFVHQPTTDFTNQGFCGLWQEDNHAVGGWGKRLTTATIKLLNKWSSVVADDG
jgi:hypothetical protein